MDYLIPDTEPFRFREMPGWTRERYVKAAEINETLAERTADNLSPVACMVREAALERARDARRFVRGLQ